jgi:hypothetical protein
LPAPGRCNHDAKNTQAFTAMCAGPLVTVQLHERYLTRNIDGYRCHGTTGAPYPTS